VKAGWRAARRARTLSARHSAPRAPVPGGFAARGGASLLLRVLGRPLRPSAVGFAKPKSGFQPAACSPATAPGRLGTSRVLVGVGGWQRLEALVRRGCPQARRANAAARGGPAAESPGESGLARLPCSIASAGDADSGSRGEGSLPVRCRRGPGWGSRGARGDGGGDRSIPAGTAAPVRV